jgi:hypothetical protein
VNTATSSIYSKGRKQNQFIPLPWKIGEFVLKNVNKIDDFTAHFSIFNLRYDEDIRLFDHYDIFRQHLQSLSLDDCLVNKHLPKNIDSDDPASDTGDVEIVQSCTKLYMQQGKGPSDKSVQSTNTTPKSRTSRSIAPTAHHNNKETQSSSTGGGDNDPPHSKIDSSHKLLVEKKRKKMWVRQKSRKFRVRTWNLTLISMTCSPSLIGPKMTSTIAIQWTYMLPQILTKINPSCSRGLFFIARTKD